MQTKSANSMLVHNYRAVLKKCFWANIADRQTLLKSLGSLVSKSAIAGLIIAGMTGLAGNIEVNSQTGSVSISPCIQNITQTEESEFTSLIEENDLSAVMSEDQFCLDTDYYFNGNNAAGALNSAGVTKKNENGTWSTGFTSGTGTSGDAAWGGGTNITANNRLVFLSAAEYKATTGLTMGDATTHTQMAFSSFCFAGITVGVNSTVKELFFSSNSRSMRITGQDSKNPDSIAFFDIKDNFSMGTTKSENEPDGNHYTTVYANTEFKVALGKELKFYTAFINAYADTRTMTVSGGGILKYFRSSTSKEIFNANWKIIEGSTLDLYSTNVGERTTLSLGSGSITLSGGSTLNLKPGNHTIANDFVVGSGTNKITGVLTPTETPTEPTNITLNGKISFEGTSNLGMLDLSGVNITNIASQIIFGFDSNIVAGTYSLLKLKTSEIDTSKFILSGVGMRRFESWQVVDNILKITLNDTGAVYDLVWTGGSGVWGSSTVSWDDIATTDNIETIAFVDGDSVSFNKDATIDLQLDVSPAKLSVTAGNVVINSAANKIIGGSEIEVTGGTLTLNMANDYVGGTIISGGALYISNINALGTGGVTFGGGTLGFVNIGTNAAPVALEKDEKAKIGMKTTTTNDKYILNLNNSYLTASNISFTGPLKQLVLSGNGEFTYSGSMANITTTAALNSFDVSEGVTLKLTGVGTGNSGNNGIAISGTGTIIDATKGSSHYKAGASFTGTFKTDSSNNSNAGTVFIINDCKSTSRMKLELKHTHTSGFVLTSSERNTLYLSGLTGSGNIAYSYNTSGGNQLRQVDLELTEDNTYDGLFVYDANRMGSVTIGSKGGDKFTFTMTKGLTANVTNYINSALIVNNATVNFANSGKWNSTVLINEGGTVKSSIQQTTGIYNGTGTFEYFGVGNYVIGAGGMNVENFKGTMKGSQDGDGKNLNTITVNGTTGSTFENWTTVSLANGSTLNGSKFINIGQLNIAADASITLQNGTSFADLTSIVGSGTINLDLSSYTPSADSILGGLNLTGNFKLVIAESNYFNLGDFTLGGGYTSFTYKDAIVNNGGVLKLENFIITLNNGVVNIASSADSKYQEVIWNDAFTGVTPTATLHIAPTASLDCSKDDTYLQTVNGKASTVVKITGGGGANIDIYGGANESGLNGATVFKDIWLSIEGGTFNNVVGAYWASWEGTHHANLVGDIHIQLKGDVGVNYIVGGNRQGGNNRFVAGDIYIAVTGDSVVKGSIIGANTSDHNSLPVFNGNTYITINNLQNINSAPNMNDLGNNLIIGGSARTANSASSSTINGNTNIVIDLADGLAGDFNKQIVGGSYGKAGTHNIYGNTSVTISASDNVNFNNVIFAGSIVSGNKATISGSTNLKITGGTFNNYVYGGGEGSGNTINGGINIVVSGGVFKRSICAGSNGGTVEQGTSLTITGGTFEDHIIGGSSGGAFTGKADIAITGGNFATSNIFGGSSNGIFTGDTNITINGVTANNVIGGSYAGTFTGNTNITVSNSIVNGGIIGSSLNGGEAPTPKEITGTSNIVIDGTVTMGEGTFITGGSTTAGSSITIKDVVADSNLINFAGEISGGTSSSADSERVLVLDNIQTELKAKIDSFTKILVEKSSNVTLGSIGGATTLTVEANSSLAVGGELNGNIAVNGAGNTMFTGDNTTYTGTVTVENGKLEVADFAKFGGTINNNSTVVINKITTFEQIQKVIGSASSTTFVNTSTQTLALNGLTLNAGTIDFSGETTALTTINLSGAVNFATSTKLVGNHLNQTLILADGWSVTIDGKVYNKDSLSIEKLALRNNHFDGLIIDGLFSTAILGDDATEYAKTGWNYENCSASLVGLTEYDAVRIVKPTGYDANDKFIIGNGGIDFVTSTTAEATNPSGSLDLLDISSELGDGIVVELNDVAAAKFGTIRLGVGTKLILNATGDLMHNATNFTKILGAGTIEVVNTDIVFALGDEFTGSVEVTVDFDFTKANATIGGAKELKVNESTKTTLTASQFEGVETISGGGNIDVKDITNSLEINVVNTNLTGVVNATTAAQSMSIVGAWDVTFQIGENFSEVSLGAATGQTINVDRLISEKTNLTVVESGTLIFTGAELKNDVTMNDNSRIEYAGAVLSSIKGGSTTTFLFTGNANSTYSALLDADNGFSGFNGTLSSESSCKLELNVSAGKIGSAPFTIGTNWSEISKTGAGILVAADLFGRKLLIKEGTIRYNGKEVFHGLGLDISADASLEVTSMLTLSGQVSGKGDINIAESGNLVLDNGAVVDGAFDNGVVLGGSVGLAGKGTITIYDGTTIYGITIAGGEEATDGLIAYLKGQGLEVNYIQGTFGGNLDPYWKNGAWDAANLKIALGAISADGDTVIRLGYSGVKNTKPFVIDDYEDLKNKPFASFEIGKDGIAEIINENNLNASEIVVDGQLIVNDSTLKKVVTGSGIITTTASDFTITEGVDNNNYTEFKGVIQGDGANRLIIEAATVKAAIDNYANVDVVGNVILSNKVNATQMTVKTGALLSTESGFTFFGKLTGAGNIESSGSYFLENSGSDYTGTVTGDINIVTSQAFAKAKVDGKLTVYGTGSTVNEIGDAATLTLNISKGTSVNKEMLAIENIGNLGRLNVNGGDINGNFILLKVADLSLSFTVDIEGVGSLDLDGFESIINNNGKYVLSYEDGYLKLIAMTINDANGQVVERYDSSASVAVQTQQLLSSSQALTNVVNTRLASMLSADIDDLGLRGLSKVLTSQERLSASVTYDLGMGVDNIRLDSERSNVWGEAVYSHARHDALGNFGDNKENTYGGMVGYDKIYSKSAYGFFVGGLSSEVKGDSSKTESQNLIIGAYGACQGEYLFVNYGGMAGIAMVDSERIGGLNNEQITGDYNSYLLNVYAEIGTKLKITENTYGRFSVGAQYSYIMNDSYDESVGGNSVESADFNSFSISADARFGYRFKSSILEARVGIASELLDKEIEGEFSIIDNPGSLYSTQGGEIDSFKVILGLDYRYQINENWSVKTSVLGEIGDKNERITATINFMYSF